MEIVFEEEIIGFMTDLLQEPNPDFGEPIPDSGLLIPYWRIDAEFIDQTKALGARITDCSLL